MQELSFLRHQHLVAYQSARKGEAEWMLMACLGQLGINGGLLLLLLQVKMGPTHTHDSLLAHFTFVYDIIFISTHIFYCYYNDNNLQTSHL